MFERVLFNDGWEFVKTPIGTEDPAGLSFEPVDIPHDWMIRDTGRLYDTSTGWYRRLFTLRPEPGTEYIVRFGAVYMDSRVYVNGKLCKEWKYGYSTFEADLTPFLREGENELTVRVDYREPNTRWYSGAGIIRDVYFITRERTHLMSDGLYLSADDRGSLTVTAEAEFVDRGALTLRAELLDGETVLCAAEGPFAEAGEEIAPVVRREGCGYAVSTLSLRADRPRLWSLEDPYLYTLRATLLADGRPAQTASLRFGFRRAEFTPDRGFLLNGRHVKLHGCCEHHDLGALGAAFNRSAMRRKLRKLREMGINAIRTSHNMPDEGVLELADELGFLIVCESFDMWEWPKTQYDYARFFPEWAERDVASWVRRDRSHPCVIAWSIGNEIYDTHASPRGQEITARLIRYVREFDYRANAPITHGSNYMQWEGAQKCTDLLKLAGYNYAERLYAEHHAAHPDWCIYGSETASCLQSRGIYHFPRSQSVLTNDDYQCSSLGNCTTGWGAANTEACIIPDRDAEYCAGQFIWTGFDYIGEPTPYDTKNSYFGQLDTAGFPKDSFYIFKGAWTDHRVAPFVHVFPWWDFSEGAPIDIRVATNAPRAALFFNGEKVAEKRFDLLRGKELTLDTVLPYRKGTLTAVAYDEEGRELAREEKCSFGDAAALRLRPENAEVPAGTRELIFVEIDTLDAAGIPVENANNRVRVEVTGAGRLVGLDNGDSTDYDRYVSDSRRLFSGKLLAIIAPLPEPGEIRMRVTSPGLAPAETTLRAFPGAGEAHISFLSRCEACVPECGREEEIPVRKIELLAPSPVFDAEHDVMELRVRVFPENATYRDELEFKLVNPRGVETALAEVVSAGAGTVTVRCRADGEFRLRAACRNGTSRCHVLGEVRLEGRNLGKEVFNPYEPISAGLNTARSDNLGNGIENGVSFASGAESWFAFENVDFGAFGSDMPVLPVFANTNDPVYFRIYDGLPGEGELLGTYEYHLPSKWMVFQEQSYRLPRRLKGIHTVSFASADGFQVKSIRFEKAEKEYSRIPASDCEGIYGDSFTVGDGEITGIGNNVMIDFGEFRFTDRLPRGLLLEGRSVLETNSVHIIFRGERELRTLAEFAGSEDYVCREFPAAPGERCFRLLLAFLPGSRFDLKSIRFV